MRRSLAALALLGVAATATGANAQGFLTIVKGLGLTNDDYRIATDEAATLYQSGDIEVGADSIWQNPESGAYGKVEIVAYDGRCVTIEHVFRSGINKQIRKVDGKRCRGEDGVWRIP